MQVTETIQLPAPTDEVGRRRAPELPQVPPPRAPDAGALWTKVVGAGFAALIINLLDGLARLLANKWLLDSLNLSSVFWTNFRMGATLFAVGWVGYFLAIALPAFLHPISARARRAVVFTGVTMGIQLAVWFATYAYLNVLIFHGPDFGKADPVFGRDISFYVFELPTWWEFWRWGALCAGIALVTSVGCAYFAGRRRAAAPPDMSRLTRVVAIVSTPFSLFAVAVLGVLAAIAVRLLRYDLLIKDNNDSSIYNGAQYLDVAGLFSTNNYLHLSSVVILLGTVAVVLMLRALNRGVSGGGPDTWRTSARKWVAVVVLLAVIDLGFEIAVYLRYVVFVSPNEPTVQLPYIKYHVDFTRDAYKVENLEIVEWSPKGIGDPLPDVNRLLASAALKNVPLWPGFTSYLERVIDPQHLPRVLQLKGDPLIYGPSLDTFNAIQKLRPYYEFLAVDSVRYTVNGEKRLFTSAVRELPLGAPQAWLTEWANRFMLFTHGWGLVMAPGSEMTKEGYPVFVSSEIPIQAKYKEIETPNPRVYYGEGSEQLAFTNAVGVKEFDYPTSQERAEYVLSPDVPAGVPMDSVARRMVLGYLSQSFFDVVFSGMIGPQTRAHYLRTPIERMETVAPFLYWDTNTHAFAADGRVHWLVNGVAHTNRYPYSQMWELGDKSDERAPRRLQDRPNPWFNYGEDAVKGMIDGFTGQVKLYKISNDPIIKAWAEVYPDLFVDGAKMPPAFRAQLTYPSHFFHVQFDDVYVTYTMKNPMTFFNYEDPWDDGDEVMGAVLDSGKGITFSIEPYHWIVETGRPGSPFPAAESRVQFAQSMIFTAEKAYNLRAIPTVYQDGKDYGRIVVLQIPKGLYVIGPQQADAAIDQDPEVSRLFAWWNRRGAELIRGHTTPLVIGDELLYVEPIFLRSPQEPIPQLKHVSVVLRGEVGFGPTVEDALRVAVKRLAERQKSGGPSVPEGPALAPRKGGGPGAALPGRR